MSKKLDIVKNVSYATKMPKVVSTKVVDSFLSLIKKKSTSHKINISNFGVFFYFKTSERIGRNPKTKESYIITSKNKLKFLPSNKLKKIIN